MNVDRWLLLTVAGVGIISFAGGVWLGRSLLPNLENQPLLLSTLRPPAKELGTALGILMSRKPEEMEQTDEATLYLSTMAGLPGSENIDLNAARVHFEDLARMVQKQTEATSRYQHSLNSGFKDTPEFKAVSLVEALKSYEEADRTGEAARPESLFLRNPTPLAEPQYDNIMAAAMAGKLRDYRPPMVGDFVPEVQGNAAILNNPLLILTVGRLLGYNLYLVKAPDHLFVRWVGPDGKTLFNIDEQGKNYSLIGYPLTSDKEYDYPPESQIEEGGYFKSLSHAELFAFFLQARGHNLGARQKAFDAELAYAAAHRFAPDVPIYGEDMRSTVGQEMHLVGVTWKDLEKNSPDYFNPNPPKPDKSIGVP